MQTIINGRERRLIRHLIKKELKVIEQYQLAALELTGYCRTPTSVGLLNRTEELQGLLNKLT